MTDDLSIALATGHVFKDQKGHSLNVNSFYWGNNLDLLFFKNPLFTQSKQSQQSSMVKPTYKGLSSYSLCVYSGELTVRHLNKFT